MKALIIGATGATGMDLVNVLLQDPDYKEVVVFVRRPTGIVHIKLSELVVDFDQIEEVSASIKGDVWFSCLGTTLKAAGSKEKHWHIDYEIPVRFAHIAKRNGISRAVLLSSYGALSKSNVSYLRIKGQLEEQIASLAFDQYIIFRPGILLRKDTDRLGEEVSAGLLNFMNGLGLFKKFRPMPTSTLAEKMAKAPKVLEAGKYVIERDEIFGF
ncbi:NAD(P)H-binding protein [Dyadobacter pollutisoli]|uniref:NAD(P)H-binding protein n=1 Tax=Dyadobacter pollutisoli TaxID=2910158 RepID=A0A9E8SM69_9BACT|nr:NAD(P)H-binding protein [Dyadobacter pollutisoli]WAC12466.1 NAD(P)H-binding protein [Dyadobacter pollutisoli]